MTKEEVLRLASMVEKKQEISDDDLEAVAGGVIATEDWNKMTPAERQMALIKSQYNINHNLPCDLL